jgi:hypothetical protein
LTSKRWARAKDLPRLNESRWDAQWMLSCCAPNGGSDRLSPLVIEANVT